MNKLFFKRFTFSVVFLLSGFLSQGQAPAADLATSIDNTMRSHDKIYVVMAVCITILVALFLYLIRIDNKVSKKEKAG